MCAKREICRRHEYSLSGDYGYLTEFKPKKLGDACSYYISRYPALERGWHVLRKRIYAAREDLVVEAVNTVNGNRLAAARLLGTHEATIHEYLKNNQHRVLPPRKRTDKRR